MDRSTFGLGVSSYIGVHFVILGLVSWVSGQAFLIPSLGPSIYVLSTLPDEAKNVPQRVVGGQFIGAVAGFVAFEVFVGSVTGIAFTAPLSLSALGEVLSAFLAAILTTVSMYVTGTQHPPAYATTLIVSLGLLPTLPELGLFMIAVLLMVATHGAFKRSHLWNLPYEHTFE